MTQDQIKQLRKHLKSFMKGLATNNIHYHNRTLVLPNEEHASSENEGLHMADLTQKIVDEACSWLNEQQLEYVIVDEPSASSYPVYTFRKSIVMKDVYDKAIERNSARKYFIYSTDPHIAFFAAYGGPYAQSGFNI